MKVIPRRSAFIKQFSGPGENRIVCFRFWQAIVASGCPGECAYCFLQTQFPYRRGLYDLKGTLFENLRDIVPETIKWLKQPRPAGLIVGENQDGLAFEKAYKQLLGVTPLELLIPLFEDRELNPVGHTLIVLSKFTGTQYAEALGPSPNVVFSWSLSLPTISRLYEKKVAPLANRLSKAASMKEEGYRIRFRLDALAPLPGWESELGGVVSAINEIGPEMLTVGALRASNVRALRQSAASNGRDDSIFDYINSKDPSGFKYRTEFGFQVQAFQRIQGLLDDSIALGLCKEDQAVWKAIGLPWQGCHCLHGNEDLVTSERCSVLVGLQDSKALMKGVSDTSGEK
jgi:DNA repair photolyase